MMEETLEGLSVTYVQRSHATFFNLDITIQVGTFIYKLFGERLISLFHGENVSCRKQYPSIYFVFSKGEFSRISETKELLKRLKQQGSKNNVMSTFNLFYKTSARHV